MVVKKHRVDLQQIKTHSRKQSELRKQLVETAKKDRDDQIYQQKMIIKAQNLKLDEFKTHVTEKVLEEDVRLKAKIKEDHETKLSNQRKRGQYAS